MWFKYGLGASALSGRVELTCETSVFNFNTFLYHGKKL